MNYSLKEHRSGCVEIDAKEYKVILWEDRLIVSYTEHRPNHDHNDHPRMILEIPKGGVVDPFPFGTGYDNSLKMQPAVLKFDRSQNMLFKFKEYSVSDQEFSYWDVISSLEKHKKRI